MSYLQDLVNRHTAARDLAIKKLTEDSAIWEQADMVKLKADIARMSGALEAWNLSMRLPKALIEDAAKADDLISTFGEKEDASGNAQP